MALKLRDGKQNFKSMDLYVLMLDRWPGYVQSLRSSKDISDDIIAAKLSDEFGGFVRNGYIFSNLVDRYFKYCIENTNYQWDDVCTYFGAAIQRCVTVYCNGEAYSYQKRALYRAYVNDMTQDNNTHMRYIYADNLAGIKLFVKERKQYADKLLYGKE